MPCWKSAPIEFCSRRIGRSRISTMRQTGLMRRRSPKRIVTKSAATMQGRCSSSINPPNKSARERDVTKSGEDTMRTHTEIDVHEELAGAAVAPLHKILGVLITLITLFDGYDTFNPAYVIHYVV